MAFRRKLNNALFGEFHTFEDDAFYWIADWATMLFRGDLQRMLSESIFWNLIIIIAALLTFSFYSNIKTEAIADCVVTTLLNIYVSITYRNTIGNFQSTCWVFNSVKVLKESWKRPVNNLIHKEMIYVGKISKKVTYIYLMMLLISYILYLAYLVVFSTMFAIITLFPYNKYIFSYIFGFLVPEAIFYVRVPIFITCYNSWHAVYGLKMLNSCIEDLRKTENNWEIEEDLYTAEYQRKIAQEIAFISKQHRNIQKLVNNYNDGTKWHFLLLFLSGGITIAAAVCSAMASTTIIYFAYLGVIIDGLVMILISTESGQQVQIKCEDVCANLQNLKWYRWSLANRKSLIVLLNQLKDPFELKCYGLAVQNRALFLKLFRILHTYITYYQSMQR